MGLGMANLKCSRILVVAASTAPGSHACTIFFADHSVHFHPSKFRPEVGRTEHTDKETSASTTT